MDRKAATLVLAVSPIWAQSLDAVLARMDAGSVGFRSVAADIKRTSFTAVINDRSEEFGSIKLAKNKNDVRVLLEVTRPDARSVAFAGDRAQIFYPKINTVQEIDLGKQKSLVEQFVLLGFGTSGKELGKNYTLKYTGEEPVAGQKASRIELTPKSRQVKEQFARMELWIADPGGFPVQQKLYEPSGNFLTVTYSAIKLNPNLGPDSLSLRLPKDVKREYPQK